MEYKAIKGAIIGDVIGSAFEWDNVRNEDFELFNEGTHYTDDTVLTVAVLHALTNPSGKRTINSIARRMLQDYGNKYANGEYGIGFAQWLKHGQPYGSCGNGCCMRISPCLYIKNRHVRHRLAIEITDITHNHPQSDLWVERYLELLEVARQGKSAFDVYLLSQDYCPLHTVADYRETNEFDETIQGTMPVVLAAVLEADGFEDCIRKVISMGGDSDTIACIAGALAGEIWGIPEEIWEKVTAYLPPEFLNVLEMEIAY